MRQETQHTRTLRTRVLAGHIAPPIHPHVPGHGYISRHMTFCDAVDTGSIRATLLNSRERMALREGIISAYKSGQKLKDIIQERLNPTLLISELVITRIFRTASRYGGISRFKMADKIKAAVKKIRPNEPIAVAHKRFLKSGGKCSLWMFYKQKDILDEAQNES